MNVNIISCTWSDFRSKLCQVFVRYVSGVWMKLSHVIEPTGVREVPGGKDGDNKDGTEWGGLGCEGEDCKKREGMGPAAEETER